jgi:hypothetical protein
VVTGYYQPQQSNQVRSFIYDGSKFTEVPVTLRHDGHVADLIQPSGINNQGQVVGAIFDCGKGSDGFLATPASGADATRGP